MKSHILKDLLFQHPCTFVVTIELIYKNNKKDKTINWL
jgi:hypothetical protein